MAGILLALLGVLIPAPALLQSLTGQASGWAPELVSGADYFKISLMVLGLFMLALTIIPVWQPKSVDARPRDPANKLATLLVLAVLAASAALRLYQLNSGLWLDEILTNVLFARMPFGDILTTYQSENQHFLYSLMAHGSFLLFGESAWALRLPAVIFGVGSIWALYLLGRQAAGTREGLLAAALMAFSYQHVWFSQNARGYTGLLFWAILSTYFLLRALREGRAGLWLLYAISIALGMYTHITMAFVILGQFVVYAGTTLVAWKRRQGLTMAGLLLGFVLGGLLTLQLYALVLPQMIGTSGREPSLVEAWKNPLWTLLELVNGVELSFAGGLVALAALVVLCIGLVSYARSRPAVVVMLLLPPAVTALVVLVLGHHMWPRLFFFALGFGALIVVRGAVVAGDIVGRFIRLPVSRQPWVGTAAALGLVLVASLSLRFVYGPKQDYGAALDFVRSQLGPGDVVATASLSTFVYDDFFKTGWPQVKTGADLEQLRSDSRRVWLVYTFPPVMEAEAPEVMAQVQKDFTLVKQFEGSVGDGTVFVVRADGPGAPTASK
ncbi:MAG: glycosyltransferase family 39 protein [Rudaea sp.]